MLNETPRSSRLHIGIFGRRNVGKSTLVNALTGQQIALVSELAGTTTDPVYKSMEILPIGPVTLIDTAGLDDTGTLGDLRVNRTRQVLDSTDLALLVFSATQSDTDCELAWYEELRQRDIPVIGVVNRIDEGDVDDTAWRKLFSIPFVKVSAKLGTHIDSLISVIKDYGPRDYELPTLAADLVCEGDNVVLVAPPDLQSPKGRLKLIQTQVIRDLLDNHISALVTTERELPVLLDSLKEPPDLVITDSQYFDEVAKMLPKTVRLTSFSIILARFKGDLGIMAEGARAISNLRSGDKVLIAEACTHHALKGDIAREKLPQWLQECVGGPLDITVARGIDFPEDLSSYRLIVHCGSCMFNRRQVMNRVERAVEAGIPITNFGLAIAYMEGIMDRALSPFASRQFPSEVPLRA